jgi:hypothetical protein
MQLDKPLICMTPLEIAKFSQLWIAFLECWHKAIPVRTYLALMVALFVIGR